MRTPWSCLFVGWLLLTCAASGQPKRPAPIDPLKVDEDFAVQGEYVGVIAEDGKEQKYGVRVGIAQNAGEFRAIAYRGGLPGDGWDKKFLDEKNKRLAEWPGQTRDGATTFPKFLRGSASLRDGMLTVR